MSTLPKQTEWTCSVCRLKFEEIVDGKRRICPHCRSSYDVQSLRDFRPSVPPQRVEPDSDLIESLRASLDERVRAAVAPAAHAFERHTAGPEYDCTAYRLCHKGACLRSEDDPVHVVVRVDSVEPPASRHSSKLTHASTSEVIAQEGPSEGARLVLAWEEPMSGWLQHQVLFYRPTLVALIDSALCSARSQAGVARDKEWISRLGLTSTSMEAALNTLHNQAVDAAERIRELETKGVAVRDEALEEAIKMQCKRCLSGIRLVRYENKFVPEAPHFVHCDHAEPCPTLRDDILCAATEIHRGRALKGGK